MADSKHVLVIEDDPMICELLVAILHESYRVSTAHDGEGGLAQVTQDRPDLILCDMLMPGLHGTDVLRRLRNNPATAEIPVVLMSGHGDLIHDEALSPNAFVQKPFSPDEVLKVIERALLGHNDGGAAAT
jgi:CheY-like chemotaxis protein